MQQAGQATSSFPPDSGNVLPPASAEPGFVINLCASTTPMALPRHEHPELKRFTFFISRRREDGRERFRLHMGYFATQEGAEQLLELVREIYPAAWAGVAPGQRLRAAADAAASVAAAVAAPAAAPVLGPAVAAAPPTLVPPVAMPVVAAPARVPVAPAAIPAIPAVPAAPAMPAVAATPAAPPVPVVARPAATRAPAPVPASAPTPVPVALVPAEPAATPAAQSLNSVRAAISSLEPAKASAAPVPVPPTVVMPELRAVPVARPAVPAPTTTAAPPLVKAVDALSDSQVLRVLEPAAATAAPRSETAAYAVQLLWSVQPIDMGSVPQLAIFSAYTLYGAAGNRDGRRWYGLRLGFFTDAVSAKQVANYVRSEFTAVSIVPVSARERDRALAAAPRAALPDANGAAPKKTAVDVASTGEFRLLDEKPAIAKPADAEGGARPTRGAPGKRAKLRTPPPAANGAAAPKRRQPLSLEETLEILGASELKLQDGRDDPMNDSGVRHLRAEAIKGRRASRFTKLMDRLSERFGGS